MMINTSSDEHKDETGNVDAGVPLMPNSSHPDSQNQTESKPKPGTSSRPHSLLTTQKKSVNFEDDCVFTDENLITKKDYQSPVDRKVSLSELDEEYEGEEGRAAWGGKLEFIFTCIGYAVGLGNVWRFPYLCYKNGGGAFLVPYIFMLVFVGLPLFYMELAFGQFASLGPITVWRVNPLLKGLGYAMVSVSWLIGVYYNVIIAHVLFFFVETLKSFGSPLPWQECGHEWNTKLCIEPVYKKTDIDINGTSNVTFDSVLTTTIMPLVTNGTGNYSIVEEDLTNATRRTPTEEFYYNYILEKSSGIDEMGGVNWKLALCLMLAWAIVILALIRGISSLGKVVYFTALFPYLVLTIMLIRGVTLPGAWKGIVYYLKPDFSQLANARVWADAATQIFFSLSACNGGLIAMASYNKFNNNCQRDALIVALINCGTSLYAGFVIFSVLGFMATEKGVDVSDVAEGGPGLAFVVYPEAVARMPVSHLWAVLFFIMMATLGFGSQFSIVECVLSAFTDELSRWLREKKYNITFRVVVCFLTFLLGLPMVCKGGIYLLNLVDFSVSGFPLLIVGFLEVVALNWLYGFDRFAEDISMMLGKEPNIFWKLCWVFLSPIIIGVTIIFNFVFYSPPELKEYKIYYYPGWAIALSWLIAIFPVSLIIGYFLYYYCKKGGFELMKYLGTAKNSWGPALPENRYGERYCPEDMLEEAKEAEFMPSFLQSQNHTKKLYEEPKDMKDVELVSFKRKEPEFDPYASCTMIGAGVDEESFPVQARSGQDISQNNQLAAASLSKYAEVSEKSSPKKVDTEVRLPQADGREVPI